MSSIYLNIRSIASRFENFFAENVHIIGQSDINNVLIKNLIIAFLSLCFLLINIETNEKNA